jgi:hypothetical protein
MEEKKKPSRKKKEIQRTFIQVGKAKIEERALRYSDLILDGRGWVVDMLYRPINFDMLLLKIKDRPKHVPGWWNGTNWCGLHFRPQYQVTAWKRYGVYE